MNKNKWKLKKMSYEELGDQLKAVRSLLYYYQRGRSYRQDDCPLCEVTKYYHRRANTCDDCLWVIIENMNCGDFVDENIGINYGIVSVTNLPEWYKLRIPMLRRWERIIQAERDCRTQGGGP